MRSEYKSPTLKYDVILAEVQRKLPNGRFRFAEEPHDLANMWWPSEPTWEDRAVEDYSGKPDCPELKAFEEEVAAIGDYLKEKNYPLPGDSLRDHLQLRSAAISTWERIGRPIRINASTIHYIQAPVDVLNTATLRKMPTNDFIYALCGKTARDAVEIAKLQGKVNSLSVIATISTCIAVGTLFSTFL